MKDPKITVARFESYFANRTQAAEVLGCSRQTLYDWVEHNNGLIPGIWSWKAKGILERRREEV